MKSFKSIFVALAVMLLFGAPAMAQSEIYAIGSASIIEIPFPGEELPEVEPDAPLPLFPDSILYKINPLTGFPTEVGPITGYTRCGGLDFHPDTEELYAVCDRNEIRRLEEEITTNNGLFESYLLILNRNTGQPTEIGPLQLSRGDFVSDMSFRSSDATLYAHLSSEVNGIGAEETTTNTISANSIATINTNTGQATVLGETGLIDIFSAIGFDGLDVLMQCTDNDDTPNLLAIVNQTDGSSNVIGGLNFPSEFDAFRTILSKDFDFVTNHFYGVFESRDFICCEDILLTRNEAPEGNFLVSINQNTGDVEIIGLISGLEERFGALTVLSNKIPQQVPTMSEYGLIATVVLLLGASVLYLRRRQAKSSL